MDSDLNLESQSLASSPSPDELKEDYALLNSNKIDELVKLSKGRSMLRSWLYRAFRIVMTDGRILIGVFLCTDSDANVILGMCTEFTEDNEESRMLGLVMVPGRHIVSIEADVAGNNVLGTTPITSYD